MKPWATYSKRFDEYEIGDEYGERTIDLALMKKLIEIVRKTHPELLEKPVEKIFFRQMKHYDDTARKMLSLAGKLCDRECSGNCVKPRTRCPFKIHEKKGGYLCRLGMIEEVVVI